MKDKNTRKHVVAAVGKVIRNEIKQLCSRNAKSVQRTRDAIKLKQFNWDAIISEATEHAPNLTDINGVYQDNQKAVESSPNEYCGNVSILCKHRNPQMTLFQWIVSLVLYVGHSAKQVSINCNQTVKISHCRVNSFGECQVSVN